MKGLLAGEDVPTAQHVCFRDFTRQVFALKETSGGDNCRGADEAC